MRQCKVWTMIINILKGKIQKKNRFVERYSVKTMQTDEYKLYIHAKDFSVGTSNVKIYLPVFKDFCLALGFYWFVF